MAGDIPAYGRLEASGRGGQVGRLPLGFLDTRAPGLQVRAACKFRRTQSRRGTYAPAHHL